MVNDLCPTVDLVLKGHPIDHMTSEDRLSLVTGSVILYGMFYKEYVILQERWRWSWKTDALYKWYPGV